MGCIQSPKIPENELNDDEIITEANHSKHNIHFSDFSDINKHIEKSQHLNNDTLHKNMLNAINNSTITKMDVIKENKLTSNCYIDEQKENTNSMILSSNEMSPNSITQIVDGDETEEDDSLNAKFEYMDDYSQQINNIDDTEEPSYSSYNSRWNRHNDDYGWDNDDNEDEDDNDEVFMPHRPTLHHPALQLKNNKMENMQNMEYSSTMSSSFDDILNNRPKLGFYQHAVRCDNGWQHIENAKIPKIQKPSTNFDKFNIDFKTLSKWQKYSYFDYYKCFINGYLREIEYEYDNLIIPNGVNQVCIKFFFNEQVHITQIAYKLCPYIGSFNYEILSHQNELKQEINIQGLTGLEIVDQIQTKLNLSEQQTINICNLAIKYGFLRLIGIRRVLAINSYDFYDNDKYLYIFDEGKQSHFTQYIKYQYSHKQTSWNISTEIQYFNNQHNIWQLAKIVAIDSENSDQVLIKPVINHNNINTTKTKLISVNRYNPKQIKSTKQYIEKRENWKNNDMINIYNHQNKIWIHGQIKDIQCKSDIENYIDILQINYKYNDKSYIDYISRWSPFIQPSI